LFVIAIGKMMRLSELFLQEKPNPMKKNIIRVHSRNSEPFSGFCCKGNYYTGADFRTIQSMTTVYKLGAKYEKRI
jgi:hypothetical protein